MTDSTETPLPSESRAVTDGAVPVVDVYIGEGFAVTVSEYLDDAEMEWLRHWMAEGCWSGVQCDPRRVFMVDFPMQVRSKMPDGYRIFYNFSRSRRANCVAVISLLHADIPDKKIWERVKEIGADTAFIAGRFVDGIFTISGKS